VIERGVEGVGQDVQSGVGSTRIRRAQRVELPDGPVGFHHDERGGLKPQTLYSTRTAQDQLDQLGEQADPGLLLGCRVPPFEDGDQPVRITGVRRRATPVRVR
jgi:hypothetical protein